MRFFKRFNLLKSDVMSYSNIPAGKDAPNDIYVIIEIPANAAPIKYEIDKDSDALFVDRFMGTAMFYPANYGYVPNTLSEDGDPLDVLVVTPHPVEPGSVIRCRPVGKLNMEDDGGIDAKLITPSSSMFNLPTGRQRITEPGSTGCGVTTSTSNGSPSSDKVFGT